MQSFNEDSEYVQLKSQIKDKEFSAKLSLAASIGSFALLTLGPLGAAFAASTGGLIAAVSLMIVAGIFATRAMRQIKSAQIESEELDLQRVERHIECVIERQQSPFSSMGSVMGRSNFREMVEASRAQMEESPHLAGR